MVNSLGRCCCRGRRVSQSPSCWSSCNVRGKMREGGEDNDKAMVRDVEVVRSLGGRETLSSMRDVIEMSSDRTWRSLVSNQRFIVICHHLPS